MNPVITPGYITTQFSSFHPRETRELTAIKMKIDALYEEQGILADLSEISDADLPEWLEGMELDKAERQLDGDWPIVRFDDMEEPA